MASGSSRWVTRPPFNDFFIKTIFVFVKISVRLFESLSYLSHCSSGVMTPVKYEQDIQLVTSVCLKYLENNEKEEIGLNSLRPSDAYMHHQLRASLAQIMACCLFST